MVVIGSRSGLEVSSEAATRGLKVAVIEPGLFGGTCLNRGCIPSKMLIHSADVVETIRHADLFGIKAEVSAIDWGFIAKRVADAIDADAAMVEQGNRDNPNITVFKSRCTFVGQKELEVGGERITAETIVVAGDTRPRIPNIDGIREVPFITFDEALRLPKQPSRIVIIGGAFIAAELAHFFGAMGTHVTIVYRGSRLLRKEDDDVSALFTEVYGRRFDTILDSAIEGVRREGDEIVVETASEGRKRSIRADCLLLAVGRVPNSDTLALGMSGMATQHDGFVRTDEYLETNVSGIWALGDIVGRHLLKHSANLEAAYAAHNIFNPRSKVPVDYHAMPHAVFASPQVAGVGLTEREAQERDVQYVVGRYDYYDTAYGASIEDRDGFVKVLVHQETGEVLGGHIIGSEASILIQEIANAMRLRLTADAFAQAIYVHPALPEVVQRAFGSIST